jgi:hypothetical protein
MECPCKDCTKRSAADICHGKCAEYAEWRAYLDGCNKKKMDALIVDNYIATKSKYVRKWQYEGG